MSINVNHILKLGQAQELFTAFGTKADARFRKVADDIAKTDLASALVTEIEGKADAADLGDLATLDEVAESNLASALATKLNGKADAATTLEGYGITDAYTKTEVDNAIDEVEAGAYKPGGSLAPSSITGTLLVVGNIGKVYNITGDFTTTADFVEGSGKDYPAGTNIVVVDADTTGSSPSYKFDILAGAYGVATQSGNGLMSATDKAKLDNADVTAYTGTGAIDVTNHVISVAAASPSTGGTGGNAGTMSAADKEKLDNADVTAYTGTGAISVSNHVISVGAASTSAAGTMSAEDKAKLDSADVTAYTGSGAIDVTAHVITVAAATPSTSGVGGNAGTMSAADKEKLDGLVFATSAEVQEVIDGLFAS